MELAASADVAGADAAAALAVKSAEAISLAGEVREARAAALSAETRVQELKGDLETVHLKLEAVKETLMEEREASRVEVDGVKGELEGVLKEALAFRVKVHGLEEEVEEMEGKKEGLEKELDGVRGALAAAEEAAEVGKTKMR